MRGQKAERPKKLIICVDRGGGMMKTEQGVTEDGNAM
jgi:hypothetical protein